MAASAGWRSHSSPLFLPAMSSDENPSLGLGNRETREKRRDAGDSGASRDENRSTRLSLPCREELSQEAGRAWAGLGFVV